MSTATYKIYVDWDNDGNYTGIYDDISADVMEIPKIMRGKDKQLGHAQAGILELRLKDLAHKYSPENSLSPLHDKLLPYRPIKVMATFAGEDYDLFNGFISKIVPHPHWAKQDAYIYALDGMDWLAKGLISTKIFAKQMIFYSDAHPETISVDGYVTHRVDVGAGNGVTWATLIAGAGTHATDDGADANIFSVSAHNDTDKWRTLDRSIFLFDTSALPDNVTILNATLAIYGSFKRDPEGIAPDINVYTSAPASNTALVAGDFDSLGAVALCDTPITYANFKVNDWNYFFLNATGIALISKTGITKLGLRNTNYDVAATAPTYVKYLVAQFRAVHADTGTAYKPKLSVSYL